MDWNTMVDFVSGASPSPLGQSLAYFWRGMFEDYQILLQMEGPPKAIPTTINAFSVDSVAYELPVA